MFPVEKLVRKNILALKPYSSARDEFDGSFGIFLDANENPHTTLNRYPDPHQKALKEKLSELKSIPSTHIFVGNGSDEVIDLAIRIFCNPGEDQIVFCPPTYGMYEVLANINNIDVVKIPLDDEWQLKIDEILATRAKMLFICSPNNPTGNNIKNIEKVISEFEGIVFVDEAYIDFSTQKSLIHLVDKYPNLIVSQTLSKAWGKAAIRVGTAYAHPSIISFFNKVKPPYNVSELNQLAALEALNNVETFEANRQSIREQAEWLASELEKLDIVEHIYPFDANFILVKTKNANLIYQKLIEDNIVVRNRNSVIDNCLRITVGTPAENMQLMESLKKIQL